MKTTLNRVAALACVLTLIAAVTAATAPGPEPAQEMEPEVTVELSELNGSGMTGTARIYEADGKDEHGEMEEEHEHGEKGEHGEMHEKTHAHRVVVELRGLEAGATYPVHVHQGTCAEGGGVVLPLESVTGGEDGTGSSTTEVSAEQMHEMMEKLMAGHGEMGEMEHDEMEHPPVYIQAHLPDGTPAACGDVPTEDDEYEG